MAFDGYCARALVTEISKLTTGGKIDKVTQPERDEIVLGIRSLGTNYKLLLSANPSRARFHITEVNKENPSQPPNFCMLLRKHILNGKILSVYQPGIERMMIISIENNNELMDTVRRNLIIEAMGKYSNIILTDENMKILDSIKHVDLTTSTKRLVLPALKYELPPSQDKEMLSENSKTDFSLDLRADKYLTEKYLGFSPLLSREITYRATGQTDTILSTFSPDQKIRFTTELNNLVSETDSCLCEPSLSENEFSFIRMNQYSSIRLTTTISEALDAFYTEKDIREHAKRLSADLSKIVQNNEKRLLKKIDMQRESLAECDKAEEHKRIGDAITSSIYMIKPGMKEVTIPDYSADPPTMIRVELDGRYSPSRNAQIHYKQYKKSITAKRVLTQQIAEAQNELLYLETVADELSRAETSLDIAAIRIELQKEGYIKTQNQKKKPDKVKDQSEAFLTVVSCDGFKIYVGKNNIQNDYLTLHYAEKNDYWFHVKNFPGSHVIVSAENRDVPNTTLTEAAILAAKNSKAASGGMVAVDYTLVKNVKKPSGAKPGMVTYETYKTAYIPL